VSWKAGACFTNIDYRLLCLVLEELHQHKRQEGVLLILFCVTTQETLPVSRYMTAVLTIHRSTPLLVSPLFPSERSHLYICPKQDQDVIRQEAAARRQSALCLEPANQTFLLERIPQLLNDGRKWLYISGNCFLCAWCFFTMTCLFIDIYTRVLLFELTLVKSTCTAWLSNILFNMINQPQYNLLITFVMFRFINSRHVKNWSEEKKHSSKVLSWAGIFGWSLVSNRTRA